MMAEVAATRELRVMVDSPSVSDAQHRWLLLHLAKGIGARTVAVLLVKFGSIEAAFDASAAELSKLKCPDLRGLLQDSNLQVQLEQLLESVESEPDLRLITPADLEYPPRLRTAHLVPPVLFVRGKLTYEQPAVAVVGSRGAAHRWVRLTTEWCQEWAERGVSVVSGLAEGIDAAAHRGALDGKGHTVAVLGTGPDTVYPSPHAALHDRILASGGAVVSQFAPRTPFHPGHFPARNSTLANLADVVVIMQAGKDSGSLYTAEAALESERTVLVAPSDLADPGNAGGLELLCTEARGIGSPGDLFRWLKKESRTRRKAEAPLILPEELAQVLAGLDFTGQSLDQLSQTLQMPVPVLLDRLLSLELAGAVARQPGSCYVRVR